MILLRYLIMQDYLYPLKTIMNCMVTDKEALSVLFGSTTDCLRSGMTPIIVLLITQYVYPMRTSPVIVDL